MYHVIIRCPVIVLIHEKTHKNQGFYMFVIILYFTFIVTGIMKCLTGTLNLLDNKYINKAIQE